MLFIFVYFQGHMSGITCVQFDHRRLISAGLDRVIRMWDIRSGRSLHKFYGHKVSTKIHRCPNTSQIDSCYKNESSSSLYMC